MLESHSRGELQAGVTVPTPIKYSGNKVATFHVPVRGTRIPASTWEKFQTGVWTPGPRTLTKLHSQYIRENYAQLRAAGVPKHEAISLRFKSRESINKVLDVYNDATKRIADMKGIPQRYVQEGIGHSVNYPTPGAVAAIDWDVYGQQDDDEDDDEYEGDEEYEEDDE